MKTAIILHGMPEESEYMDASKEAQSNCHWLPWLQQQLIAGGVLAQTPELPRAYKPVYGDWKAVFERFPINDETILVGHSCGAGFLVRWLSEQKVNVGTVALVAPWMDPHHTLPGFFDFQIDQTLPERTQGLHIFISEDDDKEMHQALIGLTNAWPTATVHRFTDRGHFTHHDMGTVEFNELAEVFVASGIS